MGALRLLEDGRVCTWGAAVEVIVRVDGVDESAKCLVMRLQDMRRAGHCGLQQFSAWHCLTFCVPTIYDLSIYFHNYFEAGPSLSFNIMSAYPGYSSPAPAAYNPVTSDARATARTPSPTPSEIESLKQKTMLNYRAMFQKDKLLTKKYLSPSLLCRPCLLSAHFVQSITPSVLSSSSSAPSSSFIMTKSCVPYNLPPIGCTGT